MNLDKQIFTTFEVAGICSANVTSIKNWIDQGKIDAFRTPGGHYRIKRDSLETFLDAHGMPNPFRERARKLVLIATPDESTLSAVAPILGEAHDCIQTTSSVATIFRIGFDRPDIVVLSKSLFDELSLDEFLDELTSSKEHRHTHIIILSDDLSRHGHPRLDSLALETPPSELAGVVSTLLSKNPGVTRADAL